MNYVLGIDQSTQGTKAILVDEKGRIAGRADRSHRQIINDKGWVSHDLEEIYQNVLEVSRSVIETNGIRKEEIAAVGISNQRETTALWDRNGRPLATAVVWQCARAGEIVRNLEKQADMIRERTGLPLSPYFPAAKMAWLLGNVPEVKEMDPNQFCLGTIDSWLLYRLTGGKTFQTDYSNASRTQLFNIRELAWDTEVCQIFGIPVESLAKVRDSNAHFGYTDLEGFLDHELPIHSVAGDSHAALFGQGCHRPGMIKTTYGTGSSIMMNTGKQCIFSKSGLATSLAWSVDGKADYVLEGNINYTGAVISWLKDDVGLIVSPEDTENLASAANPEDETILVPAFSGLSAPYWKNDARAILCGMSRTTGKKELVRAALDSIAFQIQAVLDAMKNDSGIEIEELRVDGGPTKNRYLMQRQSDLSHVTVAVSATEELSALGAAYLAGIGVGCWKKEELFSEKGRIYYHPAMREDIRAKLLAKWNHAVASAIGQQMSFH